jgi:glycosyltransferase involved in cell wall biosynthesis
MGVSDQDIASLADHENCELIESALSVEEYYKLMRRIDVLVLPYRERYETTGSGVFIEALSLGKVLVIPKRGWMAECTLMCGSQPATFDAAETASVSTAIRSSVENFASLRMKAIKAAQVWNTHQAAGSKIQSWLGERVADPLNHAVLRNMVDHRTAPLPDAGPATAVAAPD